ncbi:MAG TPA: carboxypeptidase-like regulatory domain-containing protein [Blastocatellia bacterium]|nr:carboxypeptidase-like regulatory domain-containing protein [Blastocatellia bacterium]
MSGKLITSVFRSLLAVGLASVSATGFHQQPKSRAAGPPAAARSRTGAPGDITGRVVGDDGKSIDNATVIATPLNRGTNRMTAVLNFQSVETDGNGNFVLGGLSQTAYSLRVSAPGYTAAPGAIEEEGRPRHFRPGDSITINMTKGGVITGTVTGPSGEPVVAMRMKATRIRDTEGRPVLSTPVDIQEDLLDESKTDDRGIYRLWGLDPGTYIVAAGGANLFPFQIESNVAAALTYHPSSGRAGAGEVTVAAGQEVSGIDIRWRDLTTHSISGTVLTSLTPRGLGDAAIVALCQRGSTALEAMAIVVPKDGALQYVIPGVSDGDYDVTAVKNTGESASVSLPRSVTVKGADVTGVDLALSPLATLSGKVVAEPPTDELTTACKTPGGPIAETVVAARSTERDNTLADGFLNLLGGTNAETTPNEQGEFEVRSLRPGPYRLEVIPPGDYFFVRSITTPGAGGRINDEPGKRGITIRPGENVSGFTATLAPGAASVFGRVLPENERTPIPLGLRAYLIPAETDQSDNVLRYYESRVADKGSTFSMSNLAPGRYWVVVLERGTKNEEGGWRPAAWDRRSRERLRAVAQNANQVVELRPCQKVADLAVKAKPFPNEPPKK